MSFFEQYFASFGFDYPPAKDRAELAARSTLVLEAMEDGVDPIQTDPLPPCGNLIKSARVGLAVVRPLRT